MSALLVDRSGRISNFLFDIFGISAIWSVAATGDSDVYNPMSYQRANYASFDYYVYGLADNYESAGSNLITSIAKWTHMNLNLITFLEDL